MDRAGGAVLWRVDDGGVRVAVVHRERYDDWSLPKGHVDDGETVPAAAVREVAEETGFRSVLCRPLLEIGYRVGGAREHWKTVGYYSARALDGEFAASDEVDLLRWLAPATARALLSYPGDREVLDAFTALPPDTGTLLLVRHAKAGSRSDWDGDDDLRPLSAAGAAQAAALHALLPLFGPLRVHSAPRLRCEQTVSAVADDLGVPVLAEPLLSEEGYWPRRERGLARLLEIAADGVAVVASQGGVIPDLVATLADRDGVALDAGVPCKKGSVWVLGFAGGGAGPLVSAGYLPGALPVPSPVLKAR